MMIEKIATTTKPQEKKSTDTGRGITELTIIVPCFNEQQIIEQSFFDLEQFVATNPGIRVLFVDDKSTDQTLSLLQDLHAESPHKDRMKIHFNQRNLGKGGAIKAGSLLVETDLVCYTDADLAYNVDNLLAFLKEAAPGRLLIANRLHPQSICKIAPRCLPYFFLRHVLSRIFNRLVRFTLLPRSSDVQAGLKLAFTEDFFRITNKVKSNTYSFDLELLLNSYYQGIEIVDLPVNYRYLTQKSSISVLRDGTKMIGNYCLFLLRKAGGNFR